jgi:hypothetical protein
MVDRTKTRGFLFGALGINVVFKDAVASLSAGTEAKGPLTSLSDIFRSSESPRLAKKRDIVFLFLQQTNEYNNHNQPDCRLPPGSRDPRKVPYRVLEMVDSATAFFFR